VSVKSSLGTGTYPITGNATTDGVQAIYDFNGTNYYAVSGSITVTSKTSTRIKGIFNFVTSGATPFTVTEGAFDVEY
jgi:predicted transcriptional regulator